MVDISFLSSQAREIHDFFSSMFFILITTLLLVGVVTEYFKIFIGGMPSFYTLVGRAFVATVLLVAYPDIANAIADVTDSVAARVGDLNSFQNMLGEAGKFVKTLSWSWSSLSDTVFSVIAYAAFYLIYITVYFFDAAIVYACVLLYVFSPVLIAFFVLPQTASATTALFRTLFEVCAWKIVWSILGTLLWSVAFHSVTGQPGSNLNIITMLTYLLMLCFSVVFTPIVVHGLMSQGLSGIGSKFSGMAAATILGTAFGVKGGTTALATTAAEVPLTGAGKARKALWSGTKKAGAFATSPITNRFGKSSSKDQDSKKSNGTSENTSDQGSPEKHVEKDKLVSNNGKLLKSAKSTSTQSYVPSGSRNIELTNSYMDQQSQVDVTRPTQVAQPKQSNVQPKKQSPQSPRHEQQFEPPKRLTEVPFPTEPPGWMSKRLERESKMTDLNQKPPTAKQPLDLNKPSQS